MIMNDPDGEPMFAFQDLDYIPFGYSGILAPYIETGPGTMRAAATLMALDLALKDQKAATTVVCDLGCGDGEFRKIARQVIPPPFSLPDQILSLMPDITPLTNRNSCDVQC